MAQRKRGTTVDVDGITLTLADRAPWTGGWWAQAADGGMYGITERAGAWELRYTPEVVATITAQVTAWHRTGGYDEARPQGQPMYAEPIRWGRLLDDATRGGLVREAV